MMRKVILLNGVRLVSIWIFLFRRLVALPRLKISLPNNLPIADGG